MRRGRFIVFEGLDGCGKSTQVKLLKEYLGKAGVSCVNTAEPSTGPVGVLIRQMLNNTIATDPRVVASLFVPDRLFHILDKKDGMLEKINNGISVLCDRYYMSNLAYNSEDIGLEELIRENELCKSFLSPDIIFYIDIDEDTACKRIEERSASKDIYEKKEKLSSVRKNYHELIKRLDDNITVIDGMRDIESIALDIRKEIKKFYT